jgi:hypothetical protein
MNNSHIVRLGTGLCLISAIGLTGCAGPQPLYAWNGYQTQVYAHFKAQGNGPEEQIIALEEGAQKAAAKGAKLPPGYHAHLGLLYLNTGRTDQAVAALNQEKAQFPESTKYIDFLLNNMKKKNGS